MKNCFVNFLGVRTMWFVSDDFCCTYLVKNRVDFKT